MAGNNERTPLIRNQGRDEASRKRINSEQFPELYSSYTYNNRSRTIKASVIILIVEALERLANYSVNANLMLFLADEPFAWTYFNAMQMMFIYMGISYLMSVFGGWIGDSVLGRFKTLVASFLFYWGGFAFLLILSMKSKCARDAWSFLNDFNITLPYCDQSVEGQTVSDGPYANTTFAPVVPVEETRCALWVYLGLFLISIGSGMFKANIAPFGADQVLHMGDTATRTFFSWFYWSTNLGSLLALGPIAFLQQNFDFFIGYLIPFGLIVFATFLFIFCYPLYTVSPPGPTILNNIAQIIFYAIRGNFRRACRSKTPRCKGILDSDMCEPKGWLDVAMVRYGGPFHDAIVDNVKTLLCTLLFFFTLVPYWMTYFQMETSFVTQALHMRLGLPYFPPSSKPGNDSEPTLAYDDFAGNASTPWPTFSSTPVPTPANISNGTGIHYRFPVAALSLFDVVFLIFFIPFMDWIQRRLDKKGKVIPILLRFYLGILFALMAVLWAGALETIRLKLYWRGCDDGNLPPWNFSTDVYNASCANCINQTIHMNTTFQAADMSVAFQVPQYCLIGVSEAFASVAGLEFAYNSAPRCMQGLVMGFFWLFTGVGSLLGSGLAEALRGVWFHYSPSHGLNYDRLDCYYYLLSAILATSFLFLPWAKNHGDNVDRRRKLMRGSLSRGPPPDTPTTFAEPTEPAERSRRNRSSTSRKRPPKPKEDDAAYLRVPETASET